MQQEGNQNNQLWLEPIYSGIHGLRTDRDASIKWITSSEQFRVVVADLGKQRFSGNTVSIPEVNFNRYWVLLIEMGQKPTGGYSVSLDKFSPHLSNEKALIRINWNVPNKGAVLTQMMTSPYLMLKLSKGSFLKVVVVDQGTNTLFEVDTPR